MSKTEQPPAGECFPLTCKVMYEVIQGCCGLCPWCVGVLGRYVKQEKASRKDLLTACEESQKAIMLLYECNKEVEIALGSGIQLKKAEELLQAAIAKEKEVKK